MLEFAGGFLILGIFLAYLFARSHTDTIMAIIIVSLFFILVLLIILYYHSFKTMELYKDGLVPHRVPVAALFDKSRIFLPFIEVSSIHITKTMMGNPPKLSAHCAMTKKDGWEMFVLLTNEEDLSIFLKIAELNGLKATSEERTIRWI